MNKEKRMRGKMNYKEKQGKLLYVAGLFTKQGLPSVSDMEKWKEYLKESSILYVWRMLDQEAPGEESLIAENGYTSDQTLILTDDRETAKLWSGKGYICIGVDPYMECFFEGAESVVSSILDLDAIYIEETFLRARGIPVVIAETERIIVREIRKEDLESLYELSRQEGMEYAFLDPEMAECFEPSRMAAYITTVYRLYGYGLWIVENKQRELIGCCGLSDVVLEEESAKVHAEEADIVQYRMDNAGTDAFLELQYFTAKRFQKKGYGTEMCRAVLEYAKERLPEYQICIRTHAQNTASGKLAEKLGFQRA